MTITNLLTNIVVLTLGGDITTNTLGGFRATTPGGDIPTNTPAFHAYAFHTTLTNAQAFAGPLGIDPSHIASNNVTFA
jgi:hypothetical protein